MHKKNKKDCKKNIWIKPYDDEEKSEQTDCSMEKRIISEVTKVVTKQIKKNYNRIECKLDLIIKQGEKMDETLDQLLEKVSETNTVADSLIVLTTGLKKKLDDALAGVNLPPEAKAKISKIYADLEAQKVETAQAIVDNTPAEDAPVDEPPADEPPAEEPTA